jgi:hypothetical protein
MSREWNCPAIENPVRLIPDQGFDEQVSRLRSVKGGSFKIGGQSYYVLRALFEGNAVDDYHNPPRDDRGLPIRNVRSRIADLRYMWRIPICDRYVEGKSYKEYALKDRI